jgi:hypothetical protein
MSAEPAPKPQSAPKEAPEMSKIILGSSLQMIGITMTVAGIFRGIQVIGKAPIRADNVLAFVAVVFLLAWILAYLAQRLPHGTRAGRAFELLADGAFLIAVVMIIVSFGLFAFELI